MYRIVTGVTWRAVDLSSYLKFHTNFIGDNELTSSRFTSVIWKPIQIQIQWICGVLVMIYQTFILLKLICATNSLQGVTYSKISMGSCKKDLTPLLTHWSYVFLALIHRFYFLAVTGHPTPSSHFRPRSNLCLRRTQQSVPPQLMSNLASEQMDSIKPATGQRSLSVSQTRPWPAAVVHSALSMATRRLSGWRLSWRMEPCIFSLRPAAERPPPALVDAMGTIFTERTSPLMCRYLVHLSCPRAKFHSTASEHKYLCLFLF